MNRERLQMVRDRIASEPPENTNMQRWDCGTAHCIGGWADQIAYEQGDASSPYANETFSWLDLRGRQASHLTCPPGYLTDRAYTRDDALAALDSLIYADNDDALPVWPEPRT